LALDRIRGAILLVQNLYSIVKVSGFMMDAPTSSVRLLRSVAS